LNVGFEFTTFWTFFILYKKKLGYHYFHSSPSDLNQWTDIHKIYKNHDIRGHVKVLQISFVTAQNFITRFRTVALYILSIERNKSSISHRR
jgi:hypothetical protein